MCQLGCATHISAPGNVPVGPQAVGLPLLLPKMDISNIQAGGHLAQIGNQQPWGSLCDTLSQHTQYLHPTLVKQSQKQMYIQYQTNS